MAALERLSVSCRIAGFRLTNGLEECTVEAGTDTDKHTEERLRERHRFFRATTAWYIQARKWPAAPLVKFLQAGDTVAGALGTGS
jgi:hypothetical protein